MKCDAIRIKNKDGEIVGAIVCGSRRTTKGVKRRPDCQFCLDEFARTGNRDIMQGTRQCDHPIGGTNDDGTKKTCDAFICPRHAVRQGPFDWCPEHRDAHRYVPLERS